jgi:hypothetical protein
MAQPHSKPEGIDIAEVLYVQQYGGDDLMFVLYEDGRTNFIAGTGDGSLSWLAQDIEGPRLRTFRVSGDEIHGAGERYNPQVCQDARWHTRDWISKADKERDGASVS